MKSSFLLLLFVFALSCLQHIERQKSQSQASNFTFFEMSYRGGSYGGFSFHVDSNKIFFAPPIHPRDALDTVKYGMLPDSVLQIINQLVGLLSTDTTIKSIRNDCVGCSLVAIRTVTANDTIQLFKREAE